MTQIVFIHGPGAGGCADSYINQLYHYPDSLAPNLPGHLDGAPCSSVERYTEWLRGWLHARGHDHDLVLSGFTLGACVALQYALDYPEEVKALALMTIAMRPKQPPPPGFAVPVGRRRKPGYLREVARDDGRHHALHRA